MLPTMFQFKCRDINLRLRCETFPGFQQRPGVSFFFEVDHDKPVTGICIFVGNIHSFCFQTYLIFCTTIYSLKRVNWFHKRVICNSWIHLRRLKLICRMLKPPPEFWIEVRPSCKSGHEWEIPQMRPLPLLEVVTLRCCEDPPQRPPLNPLLFHFFFQIVLHYFASLLSSSLPTHSSPP